MADLRIPNWLAAGSFGRYDEKAEPPSTPTVTLSRAGSDVRVTISGYDAGTTNTIYTQAVGATDWTNQGVVGASGYIDVALTPGDYFVLCVSVNDEGGMAMSAAVFIHVTATGTAEAYYKVTRIRRVPGENRKELTVERLEQPIFPVI